jgi:glycosyltransferase involved in cell wall biosynthesis
MASISIALATHNGARYLSEQLSSLAAQTKLPFELVISDDGSTDQTLELARAFAADAPFPVRLMVNDEALGYRLNFRKAAQACTGDLIAFCDQDDIWRDDKLEVMARCFSDPQVLLAYHNAWAFNDDDRSRLHEGTIEQADLATQPLPPFKTVNGLLQVFHAHLRRYDHLWDSSFDEVVGKSILAHDQWYLFLALMLGKVVFVDEELLDYRQHASNTFGVKVTQTLAERIANKLSHYGDQDRWAALSAWRRAEIAEAIAEHGEADLTAVATFYRQLSRRLERRATTYSAARGVDRAWSLARSVLHGDYAKNRFKRGSVLRDLYAGVLLNRQTDPSRTS